MSACAGIAGDGIRRRQKRTANRGSQNRRQRMRLEISNTRTSTNEGADEQGNTDNELDRNEGGSLNACGNAGNIVMAEERNDECHQGWLS